MSGECKRVHGKGGAIEQLSATPGCSCLGRAHCKRYRVKIMTCVQELKRGWHLIRVKCPMTSRLDEAQKGTDRIENVSSDQNKYVCIIK